MHLYDQVFYVKTCVDHVFCITHPSHIVGHETFNWFGKTIVKKEIKLKCFNYIL
jgi:hypothetical protein